MSIRVSHHHSGTANQGQQVPAGSLVPDWTLLRCHLHLLSVHRWGISPLLGIPDLGDRNRAGALLRIVCIGDTPTAIDRR